MTEVSSSPSEIKSNRYQATRNVTLVGVLVNTMLSVAQLVGGLFFNSQALIADGVHTLSDLASDFVVLVAAKIASKDADDDHPYGHGRFETVATVILGLALVGVAIGITINAVGRMLHPERLTQPETLALFFAVLAIVSKESLYHYTMRVAKRIDSKMLIANAWHHRSDAISSVFVAVGIIGSVFFQIPWLDALAAILVAILIFYMGVKLILDSTMELVDTAIEPEQTAQINQLINSIEGVEHMHMLRTRKMGNTILVDVHLQVNSYLSVSEGHFIAEQAIQNLRQKFPEMQDITVHIDPEDDEKSAPSAGLPSRSTIVAKIYPLLQKAGVDQSIDNIVLHYIDGKVEIEIFFSMYYDEGILSNVRDACKHFDEIRSIITHHTFK